MSRAVMIPQPHTTKMVSDTEPGRHRTYVFHGDSRGNGVYLRPNGEWRTTVEGLGGGSGWFGARDLAQRALDKYGLPACCAAATGQARLNPNPPGASIPAGE